MYSGRSLAPVVMGAAFVALWLSGTGETYAQQSSVSPNGRLLASNCFQCHSVSGDNHGFENLLGESANEIYEELREYKRGEEGDGLMARHAMGYTDAQLRAIAEYLATLR